jgi:broad specificity phosphatase PhoE
MNRLFLIRHGEPESGWGAGHDDPGLSERGRAQAEAAADALRALAPARIVSSPLRRCIETAAPFAAASGLAPLVDASFGEVRTPLGISDRRAWLVENFPWGQGAPARAWGEAAADLRAWRQAVIDAARALKGDVAVFTHFIATNVIVGAALGKDATIVCRPGFASITELSNEGGVLSVVRLGEEMISGEVR